MLVVVLLPRLAPRRRRALAALAAGALILAHGAITDGSLCAQQLARAAGGGTARAPDATGAGARVARAARRTSPVVLDGRITDPAWRGAEPADGFVQQRPDAGAAPTQRTEARVLYDDGAIWVAMRLDDSAPDSIAAALGRRDFDGHSDWAHVIIDSYHDRRTAFRFAVSPGGVQRDAMLSGDAEWSEDPSWDAVWEAATARDSAGWAVEMRIPLSQLRFNVPKAGRGKREVGGRDAVSLPTSRFPPPDSSSGAPAPAPAPVFGIQFARDLARRGERSYWAPIPPEASGFVSRFGTLGGLRALRAPRRLEIVPYTRGSLTRAPAAAGDPFARATELGAAVGADVRLGVTPALTLTATINPDFGQVEADPSEVNLTGLETFLTERRPFFVEGGDLFRLDLSPAGWAFGREQLVYSRRVGRAPQGEAPDEASHVDAPAATRILGAAKLSGKTAGGWSLGLLSAVSAEERARWADGAGRAHETVVEPMTSHAIARAIRDFGGGRSAVGVMATAVNRRLGGTGIGWMRAAAYTAAVDARHRLGADVEVRGSAAVSHVRGTAEAIAETQRSAAHYLQRPDAPHLRFDTTRTSLGGASAHLMVDRIGGTWRPGGAVHVVTPGFEANDAGFQARSDYAYAVAWLGRLDFTPRRLTRSTEVWLNRWDQWSLGGERLTSAWYLWAGATLRSYWDVSMWARREAEALSPTALRGGPALRTPARLVAGGRVRTDSRRPTILDLQWQGTHGADGGRHLLLQPALSMRPSTRTELAVQPSLSWSVYPAQFVESVETGADTAHVAGRLAQRTAALTVRAGYTFTPRLTLQLYAQPFLSGGDYTALREVRDPHARRFGDRFRTFGAGEVATTPGGLAVDRDADGRPDYTIENPDFSVGELRANAVLRWEYRPGSALFVVWSQGRDRDGDEGDFSIRRDARRLLDTRATNVLLVKLSYWLSP
jgi:hypothetical protein